LAKSLIITEKPSVARDIAGALGEFAEQDGYWESEAYVMSFAVGHLFELLEPEELDEKFKRWTLDVLPIIPDRFEIKKKKGQSERIRVIEKLLRRKDVDRVVNACDAGREGELIFREIVRFLGNRKPVDRLWLRSMTQTAIREGFASLTPGAELEPLGQAAECRACTDWLIGMNATRALTKRLKSRKERGAWSAGRVQTPTLALLVEQEFRVLAHVPRPYWRVIASFDHDGSAYAGTWYDPDFQPDDDDQRKDDRIFDEPRAQAIVAAIRGRAGVAEEARKPSREAAPPLFDLTALQRDANHRFGWSARRTLGAAQRCYEAHKLLTYPRTSSRCLPSDYRETVNRVLESYADASADSPAAEFAGFARHLLDAGLKNQERVFDDAGISDHFAIIPTGLLPRGELRGDDQRLYDLVLRRFFGVFHPPAFWERVERITEVSGERFRSRARALVEPGWRSVLANGTNGEDERLPALRKGEDTTSGVKVHTSAVEIDADRTKAPSRITEARLLSLMENAGKWLEDEGLAAVLHEKGLGTPATRADIIENLIAKGYAVRLGKALRPTVKGIRLIDTLKRIHIDRLASAELTGEIERHLMQVERGDRTQTEFLDEMKEYATEIVERARSFEYEEVYGTDPPLGPCPRCGRPVYESAWFYRCLPVPEVEPDDDCPMRFWKDTAGRYLDRTAVEALLRDGHTGALDGFTARNGRTYRGSIEIDRDQWKLAVHSEGWNEEATSDQPQYEVNTEPLGRCPICEEFDVVETPTEFACAERLKEQNQREAPAKDGKRRKKPKVCGFVMPRTVCKREIAREEFLVYLRTGKTELLEDFTSRFGRPFSATLVLKESGRHGFEFPPRKRKGAGETPTTAGVKTTRRKATTRKPRPKKATAKKPTRTKAAAKKATTKKPARAKATAKKATRKKGVARAVTRKKASPRSDSS
jgi:DNA topoisomerase-3